MIECHNGFYYFLSKSPWGEMEAVVAEGVHLHPSKQRPPRISSMTTSEMIPYN